MSEPNLAKAAKRKLTLGGGGFTGKKWMGGDVAGPTKAAKEREARTVKHNNTFNRVEHINKNAPEPKREKLLMDMKYNKQGKTFAK